MTDHAAISGSPDLPTEPQPPEPREELTFWERWGELVVATGVIILGVVVLVETQNVRTRPGVTVSPRIIPNIIGGALVLLGIWYAIDVVRSPRIPGGGENSEDVDPHVETQWASMAIIAFGLLCYALLIERAGFILASGVLFLISAFAMGSRRYVRDGAIALLLGAGIFIMFDSWLGVRLPAGWLAGVF